MKEFIIRYWLEMIFAGAVSLTGGCVAVLKGKAKRIHIIEKGILALLHDRLYGECDRLLRNGSADTEDKKNLEYLYIPYKSLGGNGTAERLYNMSLELPISKEKTDPAEGRKDKK